MLKKKDDCFFFVFSLIFLKFKNNLYFQNFYNLERSIVKIVNIH